LFPPPSDSFPPPHTHPSFTSGDDGKGAGGAEGKVLVGRLQEGCREATI
jgi:hypothetical protein